MILLLIEAGTRRRRALGGIDGDFFCTLVSDYFGFPFHNQYFIALK
jgi:hypothetical protein